MLMDYAMNSCRLRSSFLSGFARFETYNKCWIYNWHGNYLWALPPVFSL